MKNLILGLIVCFICGCDSKRQANIKLSQDNLIDSAWNKQDTLPSIITSLSELKLDVDSTRNYTSVKQSVQGIRNGLNPETPHDTLAVIFKELLLNRIIPYWEHTPWSFEGHTSEPGVGEIACGYFVSTTLQDVGVRINRYKLAQQSPENEANSLCLSGMPLKIEGDTKEDIIKTIDASTKEGIHFLGLDESHVGYLLKEHGRLYLIHSNYIYSEGVIIEEVSSSEVFSYFNTFYLAELSTNEAFLRHWLSKIEIEIVKG
ncbi:MAG: hypothetical protein AAFX87_12720 [Bacteroidota bacterium]